MSGVFGVVSRDNCVEELFYGTDYHSHLGTEFGGLTVWDGQFERSIHRISHGQFKNVFADFYADGKPATRGIGVISDSDPQPIVLSGQFGTFAVVTSGLITNRRDLMTEMIEDGITFGETRRDQINQTELVAKLIGQGKDVTSGIERVFDKIEGSACIIVLTPEGIYAARDRYGRFSLAVAEKNGSYAVASESCAFPNLGYDLKKVLLPGEVVFVDDSGLKEMETKPGKRKICSFLWIYTGYPASIYEGMSVESVRERCGAALARKDDVEADLVSGVPDSGTGHAVGYAMNSPAPFRRPLVKYSAGYGRSYIPRSQEVRDRVAKMKLIPIQDIISGNRLIVCEDSIVRGTQLKNLTIQKLWKAGAAEIHVRVACPPLMFPCIYNLSTRTTEELAARRAIRALEGHDVQDPGEYLDAGSPQYRRMIEWIREDLNCTSLSYLSLEEMKDAIDLPGADLCTYCWSGQRD